MRDTMRIGGTLLMCTALLSACGGAKDGAGDSAAVAATAEAPAGAGGMATPADSTTAPGSPVPASTGQMTDPEILSLTQAADEGEIATSKIAATKATNADVRKYAQEMVTEHTRMIAARSGQMKATGAQAAAGAKDSIKAAGDKMVAALNAAPKGAVFDTAYVNGQAMAHAATLTMAQKAQGEATDPALKSALTGAIPVISRHLDEARALQGKLNGSAQ